MPASELQTLRDRTHRSLDVLDGDVDRFTATRSNDAEWDPVVKVHTGHYNTGSTMDVAVPPLSVVQLDELLQSLRLTPLTV